MRGISLFGAALALSAAAGAQEGDPITLYGRLFVQVERVEAKRSTPLPPRTRLTDEASRLGIQGHERFGPDLRVFFQLETSFPPDNNVFANGRDITYTRRESGVGFIGPWGSVLAGRWGTAFEATQSSFVDPFGDVGLPGIRAAGLNQGRFGTREGNVVEYRTPRLRGFEARLNHAVGESPTQSHVSSASLSFLDATTYVALAYEKHRNQSRGDDLLGSHEDGLGLAAWQRFGPYKLAVQYGVYRRTAATDQRSYMLGGELLGRHNFVASYQRSRDGDLVASLVRSRCDVVGLGYRYHYGRRSFLMVSYARVRNQAGSFCNFATGLLVPQNAVQPPGWELRGISIGLRTRF